MSYVGSLVQFGGAMVTANAQAQMGKTQQAGYEYNATISEMQAGQVMESAKLTEYMKRKELRSVQGSQVAGAAASGVVAMSGSPLQVMIDSTTNAELDIAIGNYNSQVEAGGLRNEAAMQRIYGQGARTAGKFAAGQTMLQAGSELATKSFAAKSASTKTANKPTVSIQGYGPNDYSIQKGGKYTIGA